MDALAIAVPYVVFVWWFSTGAVLALVGLSARHGLLFKLATGATFAGALAGIVASSRDTGAASVYCAFTCAIFLWGAVEMSLLAGWITGPRPEPCPRDCSPLARVGFALQAIAYHELALIGAAALVFAVAGQAPNPLSWWTFAALLVLRQSAKLNLFLGVRTLNDELLPAQVRFIRSYFARKPTNALFPVSVTIATAAAILIAVLGAAAPGAYQQLAFALLAVLVALGALEHWFMVMPVPVIGMWRWGAPADPVPVPVPAAAVSAAPVAAPTIQPIELGGRAMLSMMPGCTEGAERPVSPKNAAAAARQRLEEEFRQAYRERKARAEAAAAAPQLASVSAAQTPVPTGLTVIAEGSAP